MSIQPSKKERERDMLAQSLDSPHHPDLGAKQPTVLSYNEQLTVVEILTLLYVRLT